MVVGTVLAVENASYPSAPLTPSRAVSIEARTTPSTREAKVPPAITALLRTSDCSLTAASTSGACRRGRERPRRMRAPQARPGRPGRRPHRAPRTPRCRSGRTCTCTVTVLPMTRPGGRHDPRGDRDQAARDRVHVHLDGGAALRVDADRRRLLDHDQPSVAGLDLDPEVVHVQGQVVGDREGQVAVAGQEVQVAQRAGSAPWRRPRSASRAAPWPCRGGAAVSAQAGRGQSQRVDPGLGQAAVGPR